MSGASLWQVEVLRLLYDEKNSSEMLVGSVFCPIIRKTSYFLWLDFLNQR